ncbi:MAG: RidA family protein [Geminicoccaceae bacterium]
MNTLSNPASLHEPLGKYHHTARVPHNSEWLAISGQVGRDGKGKISSNVKDQCEQALRNIIVCLDANEMGTEDLVNFTVYLTDARFVEDYRAARSAVIGDSILPTSTLVIVSGLATPDCFVEVEAWAAKL